MQNNTNPPRPAPTTAELESIIRQFQETLDDMGRILADVRVQVDAMKVGGAS